MTIKEGEPFYATKLFSAENVTLKSDGDEGTVEAVFSTFGIIDRDGDVVKSGAIPEVEVPIAWGHDWRQPVGRGSIKVTRKEAKLTGRFFLTTTAGLEAFNTVKEMAELQQWSWGFSVLEWKFAEVDGVEGVRVITKTEPFEVSPVLVGANQETRTVAVKDWQPPVGYKMLLGGDDTDGPFKIFVPEDFTGDIIKLVTSSESAEADASGASKSGPDGDDGESASDGDDADVGWKEHAELEMAGHRYRKE